jgi:hypothetical protein
VQSDRVSGVVIPFPRSRRAAPAVRQYYWQNKTEAVSRGRSIWAGHGIAAQAGEALQLLVMAAMVAVNIAALCAAFGVRL